MNIIGQSLWPALSPVSMMSRDMSSGILDGATAYGDQDRFTIQSSQRKFLFVDDDEALRRAFGRRLKRNLGLTDDELLSMPGVMSALEVFDQEQSVLKGVLSDMMMPDGYGLDVYHHVRRSQPTLPFAFWSGHMPEDFQGELEKILSTDRNTIFFTKPPETEAVTSWFLKTWASALQG